MLDTRGGRHRSKPLSDRINTFDKQQRKYNNTKINKGENEELIYPPIMPLIILGGSNMS